MESVFDEARRVAENRERRKESQHDMAQLVHRHALVQKLSTHAIESCTPVSKCQVAESLRPLLWRYLFYPLLQGLEKP